MTTPSTSAQAPIAVDVDKARRDFRRERQLRFFRGLRLVLLVVVPLSLLIVSGDRSVAAFLVFNNRAQQAEPKAVLRCLATNVASVQHWDGARSGEELRGPCFADKNGYKARPRFTYDYEDRGGGIFAARASDRGYHDMLGDLWAVAAAVDDEPVNCVDGVPVRGFFSRAHEPSRADACFAYWGSFPPAGPLRPPQREPLLPPSSPPQREPPPLSPPPPPPSPPPSSSSSSSPSPSPSPSHP